MPLSLAGYWRSKSDGKTHAFLVARFSVNNPDNRNQMNMSARLPAGILLIIATAGLGACGSTQYDDEREWRLRECEKILNEEDKSKCRKSTPNYI